MRTKFKVYHSLEMQKKYHKQLATLTFHSLEKDGTTKKITIEMDESDVASLVRQCKTYLDKMEEEAKSRLQCMRKAFSYSTSSPTITYSQP